MNTNNKNNDNDNTNKLHVLKQDLHKALLNSKVIAFPIAVRHAWHASGTFDVNTQTGGSDGGNDEVRARAIGSSE